MTPAPNAVSQQDSRIGGLSLICLAIGVVGPLLTTLGGVIVNAIPSLASAGPVVVSMILRIIFLLLALLLGLFSRHSRAGRFGLIGSAVVLGVVLVLTVYLVSRHAATVASPPTLTLPAP